jgi:hypothetical protein
LSLTIEGQFTEEVIHILTIKSRTKRNCQLDQRGRDGGGK